MKDIKKSWGEFRAKPFPADYIGEEIEGICLTALDTFTAGCIDTFVDGGRLNRRRISVLKDCAKDLNIVVEHLNGDAKDYFKHLLSLAERVLVAVK
jgi:hypothetical protein